MSDKKTLPLKRHETFAIREGWLEKSLNVFANDEQCFSKDKGQISLGIGTNMVKSLRFWCNATNLIKFNHARTNDFGELGVFLYKNDRYLEKLSSWWLIHLYLVTNFNDAPIFSLFFNSEISKFEKDQLVNYMKNSLEHEYNIGTISSLEADVNMIIRSYYNNDYTNPENNMSCPLSKLDLIDVIDKRTYCKKQPKHKSLDYRIVYYALSRFTFTEDETKFNIEDLSEKYNNPLLLFNLSKSSFYQYLEEMKKNGLINFIRTAGLNTVTFEKRLSLEELFGN